MNHYELAYALGIVLGAFIGWNMSDWFNIVVKKIKSHSKECRRKKFMKISEDMLNEKYYTIEDLKKKQIEF